MRDYIHVVDLAQGHLAAMKRFSHPGFEVYNLGTGHGTSVLQLVQAFKEASEQEVPIRKYSPVPLNSDIENNKCCPLTFYS